MGQRGRKLNEGLDQYGVIFHGENGYSAAAYNGFLGAWNGAPIPSQDPQIPDGSVDVNGDGKSNGVFMGSQNIGLYDSSSTQRKRKAANASFQADLGHGFTMTSDYFYAHQNQYDRNVGIQFNSTNWQGATYVPLISAKHRQYRAQVSTTRRMTANAANWAGSQIYTTQVYEKWPGDVESYSQVIRRESTAQNFNRAAGFRQWRSLHGRVCAASATRPSSTSSRPTSTFPIPTAACGPTPTAHCPAGPSSILRNWAEIAYSTPSAFPRIRFRSRADFRGRNLAISMPASLASAFANPNGWTMKTLESTDDYDRSTAITALRFDGHYKFNNDFHLNFGVRNSIRSADNEGFTLVTPVYGGIGATNPDGTPNATGCLVRYVGSDVILSGNAT